MPSGANVRVPHRRQYDSLADRLPECRCRSAGDSFVPLDTPVTSDRLPVAAIVLGEGVRRGLDIAPFREHFETLFGLFEPGMTVA